MTYCNRCGFSSSKYLICHKCHVLVNSVLDYCPCCANLRPVTKNGRLIINGISIPTRIHVEKDVQEGIEVAKAIENSKVIVSIIGQFSNQRIQNTKRILNSRKQYKLKNDKKFLLKAFMISRDHLTKQLESHGIHERDLRQTYLPRLVRYGVVSEVLLPGPDYFCSSAADFANKWRVYLFVDTDRIKRSIKTEKVFSWLKFFVSISKEELQIEAL